MSFSELPLRPLHLPIPVGWWPLAPGWWVMMALIILVIGWIFLRTFQAYKLNASRRLALLNLKKIEANFLLDKDQLILTRKISNLLRRTMLAYEPRSKVAGLTGDAWMRWLDQGLPTPYFQTEGYEILLKIPYQDYKSEIKDADLRKFLEAVRMRLILPIRGSK
tara:strand:- start:2043 stop:2534 length:492 start_codon:yes stop_codon:yes gene_type:complete